MTNEQKADPFIIWMEERISMLESMLVNESSSYKKYNIRNIKAAVSLDLAKYKELNASHPSGLDRDKRSLSLFANWILKNAETVIDSDMTFAWKRAGRVITSPELVKDYFNETGESGGWIPVGPETMPEEEVRVLLLHEDSGNNWVGYRTKDCATGEPKWQNGDMPTHWMYIQKLNK